MYIVAFSRLGDLPMQRQSCLRLASRTIVMTDQSFVAFSNLVDLPMERQSRLQLAAPSGRQITYESSNDRSIDRQTALLGTRMV
jgi:hypothetical protein